MIVHLLYFFAGVCASAGLSHLLMGLRRPLDRQNLLFAGMSFVIALFGIFHAQVAQAATAPELLRALRLELSCVLVFYGIAPWFIAEYTKLRPLPLLITFSAFYALLFAVNLAQPYSGQFQEMPILRRVHLPWGEEISHAEGVISDWFHWGVLGIGVFLAYAFYGLAKLYRGGQRRMALTMMSALAVYGLSQAEGILSRLSVIPLVSAGPFGYVGMVIVMSLVLSYEMRLQGRQLQAILDQVPAAVYLKDLGGRYLMVNRFFEKFVSKSHSEIIGMRAHDLLPKEQADSFSALDKKVLATGRSIQSDNIADQRGQSYLFHSIKFPLLNSDGHPYAICSIASDVTEQRKAEERLHKLSHAVEQSPNYILITGLDATIEYVNTAYLKRTGYRLDEIVGKTPRILRSDKTPAARYEELWARVRGGEVWSGELFKRCKDGSDYISSVQVSPVRDANGTVTNYLEISEDISAEKQAEERIQHLAQFDQLTGLPNRATLEDHFRLSLSLAQRSGEPLAVMFLDLDHFKNINDALGHSVGDQLLIEISRRLKAAIRTEDTLSRMGGDEFIVILPRTDAIDATNVAAKLIEVVSAPYRIGQHELVATPTIGIAIYPEDGQDVETLSKNADAAMHKAKQEGRNGFRFFTPAMQANSARNLRLTSDLRHALARGQLALHYQPQISLQDGRIVGAEALLRWQHPELGNISPAEFIPVAESSGLIIPIGEWVLRTAATQAKAWMDQGLPAFVISVNLSAVQFRHANLVEMVSGILGETGLPADSLELELTEAATMDDTQDAIKVMARLHERGIRMSIDDFGTGYSSLSHLKRFNIYKLKIDQSFVRDISTDPEDKAIVTAIINMAAGLGIHTIAEGVETADQLAFLRLQGCNEVQGYYFSKPLPKEQFEAYVRRSS
jgi:diguanylate cyclase (GGDEF)-like protein/PAS domain S-box-containing protein